VSRNIVGGIVAIVIVAAIFGFWLGKRSESSSTTGAASGAATTQSASKSDRRILYYRHPMGLPDTSPTPKKAADGMDYVPVYAGDDAQSSVVRITPERVQLLGVTGQEVTRRALTRTIRAVGTVQADERRLYAISSKYEGWIKKLLVNTTGVRIAAGAPLMEVYSPDLITAQQELAIARKGLQAASEAPLEIRRNMQALVDGSLQKLRNWDISEQEIGKLNAGGVVEQTLLVRAPFGGVVLEKNATEGMRFMPGEMLFRLADLSSVWMLAEVFEQDLAFIRPGQTASIVVAAYPDRVFAGKVAFVYPTLMNATRTARVRIELANRDALLKPEMFGTVELATDAQAPTLAVENSAVLDSGTRRIVLVERAAGVYEPREVKLGRRGDQYVEVLAGLAEGERVVTSANFLIDSESNLKSALGGFGAHAHGAVAQKNTPAVPSANGASDVPMNDSTPEAHRNMEGR